MRESTLKRKTKETDIKLYLNLDGTGKNKINTGIGFLDHMLELFAVHGGFDLNVECVGDINVDFHHSVEDIGIVLGKAINEAIGDKVGINRYGSMLLPMDEALAEVVLDLSGRPFLVFNVDLKGKTGEFDNELANEFFQAVAFNAGLTLHVNLKYGKNNHHVIEAIFKAFARALSYAVKITSDRLPSSKGVL